MERVQVSRQGIADFCSHHHLEWLHGGPESLCDTGNGTMKISSSAASAQFAVLSSSKFFIDSDQILACGPPLVSWWLEAHHSWNCPKLGFRPSSGWGTRSGFGE